MTTKFNRSTSPPPAAAKASTSQASKASHDPIAQGSNKLPSFNPSQITLSTFRHLLFRYPQTVEQVHRRKTTLKLQPKSKGTKRKTKDTNPAIHNSELDPSQEEHIRNETEKFIQLDTWRYEEMPATIAKRKVASGTGGEKEVLLNKEELVRIMEWKLKHGHFRPTLMGMIKSNPEPLVLKCTSSAISLLPSDTPDFPKASLDALAPLRGVGTATASLVLSIATARDEYEVPFYSDDTFFWLCAEEYPGSETGSKYKKPNGDLNVKYNANEYRLLWDKAGELQRRLNGGIGEGSKDGEGRVRLVDVERVAFVLRNYDVEGICGGGEEGMKGDEKANKKMRREGGLVI